MDDAQSGRIIDILASISPIEYDEDIVFDKNFKNNIGANFSFSFGNDIIYSENLDAYYKLYDRQEDLEKILSVL